MLEAGSRDRLVTLRKLVESQSASGAVVYTPENVATVWAQKVPERSLEIFREEQRLGFAVVVWRSLFYLDPTGDPTVKWQLLEGTRVYDILDVREIGRREGWEMVARARAEDQAA